MKIYYVHALLLLLAGASLIQDTLQEDKNPGASLVQRVWSSKSASGGFIKLAVEFVHYFVSRSLQFKYVPPLPVQPSRSTTSSSILFWMGLVPAMVGSGNGSMQCYYQ